MPELSPNERARYHRQIILPQIGIDGQAKLKAARVLLIGMGGLGSPAALYLASAGVGTLGLCDMDNVETHNLQRQILHDTPSEGTSKIESAQARLSALNPHCQFNKHPEGIHIDNALELLGQYDLVIDGSDNFPTRYLVSDAAFFSKTPYVYGSIFQFEGQVSFFDPAHDGPSYRCLFPTIPEPGSVPNCSEAGVMGALCGMIGSFQAMEAIKFITGTGQSLMGKLLCVDALTMQIRTLNIKRDPKSPLVGESPTITQLLPENYMWTCSSQAKDKIEITVKETQAILKTQNPPVLLDVREPDEWEICHIEGALLMPLKTIPERVEALDPSEPIIAYCHHGMRSLHATKFLREKGFSVQSMAGGINAWAKQIEPSMPRY